MEVFLASADLAFPGSHRLHHRECSPAMTVQYSTWGHFKKLVSKLLKGVLAPLILLSFSEPGAFSSCRGRPSALRVTRETWGGGGGPGLIRISHGLLPA